MVSRRERVESFGYDVELRHKSVERGIGRFVVHVGVHAVSDSRVDFVYARPRFLYGDVRRPCRGGGLFVAGVEHGFEVVVARLQFEDVRRKPRERNVGGVLIRLEVLDEVVDSARFLFVVHSEDAFVGVDDDLYARGGGAYAGIFAQQHDLVESLEGAVRVVAFLVGFLYLFGARAFADGLERGVERGETRRVPRYQVGGVERLGGRAAEQGGDLRVKREMLLVAQRVQVNPKDCGVVFR